MIEQFIRFAIVGASGTFIDFGSTWLCRERIKLNQYIANTVGFILAASSNYLLNRLWTFKSTDPDVGLEYLRFFGVSIIGLGINNGIIYLLNGRMKINFYISKVIATVVVVLWNFFANYLFTFRN